jgi:quinolinate synthase
MILWPGFCPTHVRIQPQHIIDLRREYPRAKVAVHPECRPDVIALADEVLSTGGICRYARQEDVTQLIVGTEIGIIYRLRKENPGKRFFPATEQAVCARMKLITLETVLWSLQEMTPEVKVPEEIRLRAKTAVDRMLEVV